jgi:membrane protein required for colicin V production
MNLLDMGILIIAALTSVRGFFRGIIQETASLFRIFAGIFLSLFYYKDLASLLGRLIYNYKILLQVFCFILIFFLTLFLIRLLAVVMRGAIRLALLGWLDRTLGGLFGLFKGMIIIFCLVSLLMFFNPKGTPLVDHSHLFPFVQALTSKTAVLIPAKIKEDFFNRKMQLNNYWNRKKSRIKEMEKIRDHE